MTAPVSLCLWPSGCTGPVKFRHLCGAHYYRARRNGLLHLFEKTASGPKRKGPPRRKPIPYVELQALREESYGLTEGNSPAACHDCRYEGLTQKVRYPNGYVKALCFRCRRDVLRADRAPVAPAPHLLWPPPETRARFIPDGHSWMVLTLATSRTDL